MGNDLRQRLEALSAEASQGTMSVSNGNLIRLYAVKIPTHPTTVCGLHKIGSKGGSDQNGDALANAEFIKDLINAFRSGDLVTRSELDEAVASEREACAKVACSIGDMHPDEDHSYHIGELVRARSEQKEGNDVL